MNQQRLEEIRDLDDLIFEEFKKYSMEIFESNFKSDFPNTLRITLNFTTSTNFIKNSIFDGLENDDLFGPKILFRSLIEHYLKFQLIWLKWAETKTDKYSEEFLNFSTAKEILDNLKAEIDAHKIHNPLLEIKSWNEIFEKIPQLKEYTKSEIEDKSKEISYKNIIRKLKQIDNNGQETKLFGSLIKEYSELSSYVHGGILSHNQMLKFADEKIRKDEIERIAGLTFQITATIKLFSLIMFIQNPEDRKKFENSYLIIDSIMKKL